MIVLLTPENNQEKIARFVSHTINAQHIWNKRLEGQPIELGVWQDHDITTLERLEHENFEISLRLLALLDLSTNISYENSEGTSFTKNIGDIFFHIINHSTYHRGQLMLRLKEAGVPPIPLDFIHYKK
jgi:uncharacterized damage-inducible protein DinB